MKKIYQGKNTTMIFEINKPTKRYQWLVIALAIVGIIYLIVR